VPHSRWVRKICCPFLRRRTADSPLPIYPKKWLIQGGCVVFTSFCLAAHRGTLCLTLRVLGGASLFQLTTRTLSGLVPLSRTRRLSRDYRLSAGLDRLFTCLASRQPRNDPKNSGVCLQGGVYSSSKRCPLPSLARRRLLSGERCSSVCCFPQSGFPERVLIASTLRSPQESKPSRIQSINSKQHFNTTQTPANNTSTLLNQAANVPNQSRTGTVSTWISA